MSYDLQVWSCNPPDLPGCLPQSADWQPSGAGWTHGRRGWQVVLGAPDRVLAEDVPEAVAAALPGIAWLTLLSLEPIGAGEPARRVLTRAASALAKSAHGVVLDPQEDTVTTPAGVKKWVSGGASENASVVNLSWWCVDGPLVSGAGFDALVEVLAAALPEALPRRYGLYEPPQHVYADTGRDHFLGFLREHGREIGVVWYPHAPVVHLHLGVPNEIGGTPKGFRTARLEIEVDAEALKQPGWPLALREAWRRIGRVVRPFYGDVRTLGGYQRSRGRYWVGAGTEEHPVCSWWWTGLPQGPVHAAVVGEPYLALWPAFAGVAELEGGLAFLTTDEWSRGGDAFQASGPPPPGPAQVAPQRNPPSRSRPYPDVWPFEAPWSGK